jgi:hypothetical protein
MNQKPIGDSDLLGPRTSMTGDECSPLSYTAITVPPGSQDFFGTRTYTWSGDPNLQISNASWSTTEIIFKSDPNVPPGSRITQTITLRETDAEGSSATASMNVVVQYPAAPPPPPDCKQVSGCQTHPF